jgi:hypothetical protein
MSGYACLVLKYGVGAGCVMITYAMLATIPSLRGTEEFVCGGGLTIYMKSSGRL